MLFIFREGKGEREREKEKNIDVQEKHWLVASHTPPTRDLATTQVCAVTRNRTSDFSLCETMPNQLSHTNLGIKIIFFKRKK